MRFTLLCPIAILLLTLAGCGSSREDTSHAVRTEHGTTKTTATATETVPGPDGPVVSKIVQTVTVAEHVIADETNSDGKSVTTVQLPTLAEAISVIPKIIPPVVKAAEGATPWGAIGGAAAAVAAVIASWKSASASAANKRAEEHKEDAAEGWQHALGTATVTRVAPSPVAPELAPDKKA